MLMRGSVVERACMRMRGIVTLVLGLILRLTLMPTERHGGGHQSLRRQGDDDKHQNESLQMAIHSDHSIGDDTIVQRLGVGRYRRVEHRTHL